MQEEERQTGVFWRFQESEGVWSENGCGVVMSLERWRGSNLESLLVLITNLASNFITNTKVTELWWPGQGCAEQGWKWGWDVQSMGETWQSITEKFFEQLRGFVLDWAKYSICICWRRSSRGYDSGWPESWTPSPVLGLSVLLTPMLAAISRMQAWENNVLLRPSGWYMWPNPGKAPT